MPRTKQSIKPSVEVVEPRVLLSAAARPVSPHTLNAVARDVRGIMTTLSRTENTARASAQLTRLSSRIPSGRAGLAPAWRQDLTVYNPRAAVSVVAAQNLILADLYRYAAARIGGNQPVTAPPPSPMPGPGPGGMNGPVSAPSLDSVKIQNTTGIALRVTIYLDVPQVQKPWITETIPAQGTTTVPFNFGTATDAFMTMDVSRADGGQSPPPLTNFSLPQPMGGYNAALFTVSIFGSYFNVTPA